MNRGYSREDYLRKVERLRKRMPNIGLTTDVIVGFPGESKEDFQETLSLLEEVQFDGIYSFKFSPRPMTRAAEMEDTVPEPTKTERLMQVQERQEKITASILERSVGRVEEILVEGRSPRKNGQVTGRTRTHRIVHAQGDGEALKGRLVNVLMERGLKHCLLGRIVQKEWVAL
jgi:tRNA-2-methylthio-N6-dimethylallyladenosine synthase